MACDYRLIELIISLLLTMFLITSFIRFLQGRAGPVGSRGPSGNPGIKVSK